MSATIIKSEVRTINASIQDVFDFICDFNNIKELLPEDKISDWQSNVDECSFKVQNAATIPLIKDSIEAPTKINIVSGEKAPFPFTLQVILTDKGNATEGYLHFEGEINAFLKMMVVSPLTNLFNYMGKKLEEKFA